MDPPPHGFRRGKPASAWLRRGKPAFALLRRGKPAFALLQRGKPAFALLQRGKQSDRESGVRLWRQDGVGGAPPLGPAGGVDGAGDIRVDVADDGIHGVGSQEEFVNKGTHLAIDGARG